MLPIRFLDALERPPRLHADAPLGVWGIDTSAYEFLSNVITPTSRSLETGLGMTTILCALLGSSHIAVCLQETEREAMIEWAVESNIDLSNVEIIAGESHRVLFELEPSELDLFIIDGGHGYPVPQLDWALGAPFVRKGGVLVLDDLQLWAPAQLDAFLVADPRWRVTSRTEKWCAYERLAGGPVIEDYDQQPFLPTRDLKHRSARQRLYRAAAKMTPPSMRRFARRIRKRLPG